LSRSPLVVAGCQYEAAAIRAMGFSLEVEAFQDLTDELILHRRLYLVITVKSPAPWIGSDLDQGKELLRRGAKAVSWCPILNDSGLPTDPGQWKNSDIAEIEFWQLMEAGTEIQLDEDDEPAPKPRPFQFDWEIFTAANFGENDDPPEPILEDSLNRDESGLLVAPGGTGKNYFAAQLGASLATGTSFFGLWSIPHPMRVLYLSAEESQRVVKKKVRGALDRLDIPVDQKAAAKERYVGKSIVGLGGSHLVRPDGRGSIEKTENLTDLHILAASFKPDVIFLDHLSKLCPVNEIDNSALTVVCSFLEELAVTHHCAVLVLHHANKTGGGGVFVHSQDELYKALDPSAVRGGTSLVANVRWALLMAPIAEDYAPKVIGESAAGENSGVYVGCRVSKKNEGPQESIFYLKHGYDGFFDLVEAAGSGSALADAEVLVGEIEHRLTDAQEPLSRTKGYEQMPKWGRRRYDAAVVKGVEMGWLRAVPKALGKGEILTLGAQSAEVPKSAQIGGTS